MCKQAHNWRPQTSQHDCSTVDRGGGGWCETSSVKLVQCNFHTFGDNPILGVLVKSHSRANLVGVSITCAEIANGVFVNSSATDNLEDCVISQSVDQCIHFVAANTGCLKGCTLSIS